MGLKQMFRVMDEELKQGLAKQGTKLSEQEVKQLMEAADEFITATMAMNRMNREHVYTAFQYFDKDNSGYITIDELEQALHECNMHDGRDIKEIISEVDADSESLIEETEQGTFIPNGHDDILTNALGTMKDIVNTASMVHQAACGNSMKQPTWIYPKLSDTRLQPNDNDCGYYVMKFMLDIVSASITKCWMEVFNDPLKLTMEELYDLRNR